MCIRDRAYTEDPNDETHWSRNDVVEYWGDYASDILYSTFRGHVEYVPWEPDPDFMTDGVSDTDSTPLSGNDVTNYGIYEEVHHDQLLAEPSLLEDLLIELRR